MSISSLALLDIRPPAGHALHCSSSSRGTAAELLQEQMVPLYVHYIDDHIARLDSLDQPLARSFEE
jgi:hypothetical protein